MSFLGAFSQAFPAPDAVYPPYYTHGPAGETYYVWPAFPQSPELSPGSSEYSGTPGVSPPATSAHSTASNPTNPVRNIKRRVTANRKERRRTMSINNAFAELRDSIPCVPPDTKLSKIKTLKLATSYIAYLMDILAQDDTRTQCSSSPDQASEMSEERRKPDINSLVSSCGAPADRMSRGRTGWPQHVWALELKHETPT